MFERLDDRALRVTVVAQEEAVSLLHNYLGTEHLLIALAHTNDLPGQLLRDLDCGPDAVRSATLDVIGRADAKRDRKQLLAAIGIDLEEIRRRAEATFGQEAVVHAAVSAGPRRRRPPLWWPNCRIGESCDSALADGWLGMAPRLKRVLEMATQQAAPASATPTHLVFAVLDEGKGVACQILERRGVDLEDLRTGLRRALA